MNASGKLGQVFQDSALLDLPAEISIEILRYVVFQQVIHFIGNDGVERSGSRRQKPLKAIPSSRFQVRWCDATCTYIDAIGDPWNRCEATHQLLVPRSHAPAVLFVCRRFRQEAVEILYAESLFDFENVLLFGDFAARSAYAVGKIRKLQVRHTMPQSAFAYPSGTIPPGRRAAVNLSWDGPAIFIYYTSLMMPQLRQMKLIIERNCQLDYNNDFAQIYADWLRFISQLAKHVGQPDFVSSAGVSYLRELEA